MDVTVLCTSPDHPILAHLAAWREQMAGQHQIQLCRTRAEVGSGDMLFIVSSDQIITGDIRARFGASLVIHASDLPRGRGWSPLQWQVLEGATEVKVTLFEAVDQVDAGPIWAQSPITLDGTELYDELNAKLFEVELQLMTYALENAPLISPTPQEGAPTYYRRRTPEDSRLDPDRSIADQFDLMRVADADRFPCFFDFRGERYQVVLRRPPQQG